MSNIDQLRMAARQLVMLLEDPQPGLSTWHDAVNERRRMIGGSVPSEDRLAPSEAGIQAFAKKWDRIIQTRLLHPQYDGRYGWVKFQGLKALRDELLALVAGP